MTSLVGTFFLEAPRDLWPHMKTSCELIVPELLQETRYLFSSFLAPVASCRAFCSKTSNQSIIDVHSLPYAIGLQDFCANRRGVAKKLDVRQKGRQDLSHPWCPESRLPASVAF